MIEVVYSCAPTKFLSPVKFSQVGSIVTGLSVSYQ